MNVPLLLFLFILLINNLIFNCSNFNQNTKLQIKDLPNDIMRYYILNYFAKKRLDFSIIDIDTLDKIMHTNQIIVSTQELSETCENLNILINMKNFSRKFNVSCKGVLSDILKNNIINFVDLNGNTILHFACQKGYESVIKFLVHNGAKVNVCANEESLIDPIDLIPILRGKKFSKEFLLGITNSYCHECPVDKESVSLFVKVKNIHPIFDAYINGHYECVKFLLNCDLQSLSKFKFGLLIKCSKCSFRKFMNHYFSAMMIGEFANFLFNFGYRDIELERPINSARIENLIYEYSLDFDQPFKWVKNVNFFKSFNYL